MCSHVSSNVPAGLGALPAPAPRHDPAREPRALHAAFVRSKVLADESWLFVNVCERDEPLAKAVPQPFPRTEVIPLGQVLRDASCSETFHQKYRDKKIVFFCGAAYRSRVAAREVMTLDRYDVYYLEGGINAWEDPRILNYDAVFLLAHDTNTNLDRVNLALSVALTAQRNGNNTALVLLCEGVHLAIRQGPKALAGTECFGGPFAPVKQLLDTFAAEGGSVYCCITCLKARSLTVDDLHSWAQESTAPDMVRWLANSKKMLSVEVHGSSRVAAHVAELGRAASPGASASAALYSGPSACSLAAASAAAALPYALDTRSDASARTGDLWGRGGAVPEAVAALRGASAVLVTTGGHADALSDRHGVDRRLCVACPCGLVAPAPPAAPAPREPLYALLRLGVGGDGDELAEALAQWAQENGAAVAQLAGRGADAEEAAALLGRCTALAVLCGEEDGGCGDGASPPEEALVALSVGCPVLASESAWSALLFPAEPPGAPLGPRSCGARFAGPRGLAERAAEVSRPRLRDAMAASCRAAAARFAPADERAALARALSLLEGRVRRDAFVRSAEGAGYGYGAAGLAVDELNAAWFARVARAGMTYLDHAGAALYASVQVESAARHLLGAVLANPHSEATCAHRTAAGDAAQAVQEARALTAAFVGASELSHSVVFTSGATAALKLIGESFDWSPRSVLCFLHGSHTSAVGIRAYAAAAGARVVSADTEQQLDDVGVDGTAENLLVLPAQSNFSGAVYDLGVVTRARRPRANGTPAWRVLLDASAYVAHARLDLGAVPADFTALSFYKVFGYPTGVGALVVRADAARLLGRQQYYGGGTVYACVQEEPYVLRRDGAAQRLESGTVSFADIALLKYGFEVIERLGGMQSVDRHVCCVARYLEGRLRSLAHSNGAPLCHVAEVGPGAAPGPVVAFNVRRSDGAWVGYTAVESVAAQHGIQLRTGWMCNPHDCQRFLGMTPDDVRAAGKTCHSRAKDRDVLRSMPNGAVRVSVGYPTTIQDVERLVYALSSVFLE
eukprot:m51a1_g14206 putative molybdenum cofactor sulfurase-like (1026) ;mRNA; f:150750-154403